MSRKAERMIRTAGDPVLKQICAPVPEGDSEYELIDTMEWVVRKVRSTVAVGLAAPQIGVAKRVIVTNCRGANGAIAVRAMINPVIVNASAETDVDEEGCLSYPGVWKRIRRPVWVDVRWRSARLNEHTQRFHGYEARVIQHEVDHLDGICRVGDDSLPDESPAETREINARLAAAVSAVAAVAGFSHGGPLR